jgi:hypothetical protein
VMLGGGGWRGGEADVVPSIEYKTLSGRDVCGLWGFTGT